MNTPESPLDKKTENLERELTLEERVNRLEHTLDGAFNQLGKYISEVELKSQRDMVELQQQLSKTLTLMNMSTLQNIITMRETLKVLISKEIINADSLEADVTAELTKAIELQQKTILEGQAEAQAEVQTEAAPA